MNRRRLLGSVVAGMLPFATGCVSNSGAGGESDPTTAEETTFKQETVSEAKTANTSESTETVETDEPTAKTPSGGNSNKSQVRLSVAHSDWEVDTSDNAVETNVFTLHNESDAKLKFNPYDWELHKKTDTGWTGNLRQSIGSGFVIVAPDERHRWSFSRVPHPTPKTENAEYITVEDKIGEGKYLFRIGVPVPASEQWTTHSATFTLDLV